MASKVGRLSVVITAGTSGLTSGLRRAETSLDRFVGSSGKAASFLGKQVRPGINAAGKAFAAMGASAAASATATALAIKSGADRIDDLADSSKRLLGNNGATGALAGLRFAAEEAGVEAGALDKGLGKLLDTISRANRGDKAAIQAFKAIGLDARNLAQLKPEERMIAVADALGKVRDAGDKISLSKGIFGKAGEGLVPLFNEGGEAIRAATKDLEMFGHAIGGLDAEKVGTMNDNIGRLKLAWEGVTMQLAVQFAPLVSDVTDRLLGMVDSAGGVGKATEAAFDAAVRFTGNALDALDDLHLGWLKFKQTLSGIMVILNDIGSWAAKPAEKIANLFTEDETERRLKMIAPDKRAEFKRRLDEAGGFQSEKIDFGGGLRSENADIQKQIAELEKRRREKGSLGERFVAWEQKAQTKGAANAALKLNDMAEKRLGTESAIARELEKQTKEKEEQKRIETGGEGKFARIAFNGVGSRPAAKKKAEAKAAETVKGAVAKAASSEEEIAPGAMGAAAASPGVASDWGSKDFWTRTLFGEAAGAKGYESKRINPDRMERKYWTKIPGYTRDYKAKLGQSMLPANEQDPEHRPRYMDKMGDSMKLAAGADPVSQQARVDSEKQDKMIALLERIAGNTKNPTLGLA